MTKIFELEDFLEKHQIDVALIQETKFTKLSKFEGIKGYALVRRDRPVKRIDELRKGGGLLTLVKEGLAFREGQPWKARVIEGQNVIIHLNPSTSVHCTNIYRPPLRQVAGDTRVNEYLPDVLPHKRNGIIMGDFNLQSATWSAGSHTKREAEDLEDWCVRNNFQIINSGEPTHVNRGSGNKNAPDISITHESLTDSCKWEVLEDLSSDHCPIVVTVNVDRYRTSDTPALQWCWKKADWTLFQNLVNRSIVNSDIPPKLEAKVKWFSNVITNAAKTAVPMKKAKSNNRPFWNDELKGLANKRNRPRKGLPGTKEEWIKACNDLQKATLAAKKRYWENFVDTLQHNGDTRRLWATVRKMNGGGSNPTTNETIIHGIALHGIGHLSIRDVCPYHRRRLHPAPDVFRHSWLVKDFMRISSLYM
jgi:exonuclease III